VYARGLSAKYPHFSNWRAENLSWCYRLVAPVQKRGGCASDRTGRLKFGHCSYQSECGDHRLHERHWVAVHWCRQAGQTPPVSNVFHRWPQVQDRKSSFRGDQPQSGQRMRVPDGPVLSSSSRSTTTDELSFDRAHIPRYYDVVRITCSSAQATMATEPKSGSPKESPDDTGWIVAASGMIAAIS